MSGEQDYAVVRFSTWLRTRSMHVSEVRLAIVRVVAARRGPYDVESLVHEVRAEGAAVSRGTVYRALPLLESAGIVRRVPASGDARHYETTAGREREATVPRRRR